MFLSGFVAAAIAWVGHCHGDPLWLLPLLAVAIAVSFVAERLWPYNPAFNHDHGDRLRDTLHAVVNEGLNLLLIAAVPLLAAVISWQLWPQKWPCSRAACASSSRVPVQGKAGWGVRVV